MSPQHVIVIGGGMVGLSTAWFLQDRGAQVTVVDADRTGTGASWGNAGLLTPALTLPLTDPAMLKAAPRTVFSPSSPVDVPWAVRPRLAKFLWQFARHCTPARHREATRTLAMLSAESLAAYAALEQGGLSATSRQADPLVAVFSSAQRRAALVHELDLLEEIGQPVDHTMLDAAAVAQAVPHVSGMSHGIAIRGQRFIDPGAYVAAIADAVRRRGGQILEHAAVEQVRAHPTGVEVRCGSGETLAADRAVIATGVHLEALARPFGVRSVVQAGRGYSFTARGSAVIDQPIYFPEQRVACTPYRDGIRVVGQMEFREPGTPLDPRKIEHIVAAVSPHLTGIDWDSRTDAWVGSRPCTADGLPLLGRTESPHVFVAGGHGMWGIALGPVSGRILADQIVDDVRHPALDLLDPLR